MIEHPVYSSVILTPSPVILFIYFLLYLYGTILNLFMSDYSIVILFKIYYSHFYYDYSYFVIIPKFYNSYTMYFSILLFKCPFLIL